MAGDVQASAAVNGTPVSALRAVAAASPMRTALVDGEARLTFDVVMSLVDDVAAGLVSCGVRQGDRVALVARNSAGFVIAAFAVWRAGAVLATAYPSSSRRELSYVFANARPRLVLADPQLVGAATAAAEGTQTKVLRLGGTAVVEGLSTPSTRLPPDASAEGAALICYTSGTATTPKPVTHSHGGLLAAARAYADVWHIDRDSMTAVCLPMAWAYGLVTTTMATLFAGGAVVSLPRFSPDSLARCIDRERVTFLPGVTTMFVRLVRWLEGRHPTPDLSSLRLCVSGGEPRNEPVFLEWESRTGCPVHDVYAASECFPVVTYDPEVDPRPRQGSAGRVVQGARMRVVDSAGDDVPPGQTGEAWWRAPAMMVGYWGEPALTEHALTDDGWYRTRDLVRVDGDGYVYVVGRLSDLIIRGGANVSPNEVESVLSQHPDVQEAAVVGLPDHEYGQRVAAAVVPSSEHVGAQELTAFCQNKLARHKIPTEFVNIPALPRNATGKLHRARVVELLQARGEA